MRNKPVIGIPPEPIQAWPRKWDAAEKAMQNGMTRHAHSITLEPTATLPQKLDAWAELLRLEKYDPNAELCPETYYFEQPEQVKKAQLLKEWGETIQKNANVKILEIKEDE